MPWPSIKNSIRAGGTVDRVRRQWVRQIWLCPYPEHACRTRDRNNKILRDVEDAAATPQTANIVFLRGATEDQFAWSPEAPSHADLPSISIFDSRSANVHVEKTNAVAYIPQPMRVLEALATACDQVKAKLDDRLAAINAKTPLAIKEPQLGADTAAGAFVRSLSTKSSIAQLDLLAQLSEAETSHLAALESDLAQEPKRAAAKITAQKARLDDGIGKLKNLVDTVSPAAFAMRSSLKSDWETKAESAKLASDALFAASPLPDVGRRHGALLEAPEISDGMHIRAGHSRIQRAMMSCACFANSPWKKMRLSAS